MTEKNASSIMPSTPSATPPLAGGAFFGAIGAATALRWASAGSAQRRCCCSSLAHGEATTR